MRDAAIPGTPKTVCSEIDIPISQCRESCYRLFRTRRFTFRERLSDLIVMAFSCVISNTWVFTRTEKRRWISSVGWPESFLERSERLEQLRFLENGLPIYVAETPFDTVGVDTEEDVRRVEEMLRRR